MAGLTDFLSGGLISTSAPNYASVAGRSEKKRQGIIRLGLDQINAVFSGGEAPFYSPALTDGAKFDPKQTYFALDKSGEFSPYWAPRGAKPDERWSPGAGTITMRTSPGHPLFKTEIFGKRESPKDIAKKSFRRGQLFSAPQYETFEGFQEPFYEKRAQDYVNFALPSLAEQYRSNRDSIMFGLANRGLGQSSVEQKAISELEREAGKGRQTIADTGLNQANQLRQGVEQARQQAISQLYQSADPAQALQGAVRSAIGFQQQPVFAPLTNMFTNLAQQYATQQLLNNYRQPFGAPTSNQDFGSFLAPIPS